MRRLDETTGDRADAIDRVPPRAAEPAIAKLDWDTRQRVLPSVRSLGFSLGIATPPNAVRYALGSQPLSPRMTGELADQGTVVKRRRVERLMRLHGIDGVHMPAKVRTTIPAEHNPPFPDLIQRVFAVGRTDVARVSDIERHEAFPIRAVVKGHGLRLITASRVKLMAT